MWRSSGVYFAVFLGYAILIHRSEGEAVDGSSNLTITHCFADIPLMGRKP